MTKSKVKPIIASPGKPVRSAGGPARISYELIKHLVSGLEGDGIAYLDLSVGNKYIFRSRDELERVAAESYSSPSSLRKLLKALLGALGVTAVADLRRKAHYKLTAYRISRQVAGEPGHLLHVHGISPAIADVSLPNLPIIWSEHSKGSALRELHMLFNKIPQGEVASSLKRAYLKMLSEASLITFPSLSAVQLFEEYTGWEVPKERLRIVYNGISDPLVQYPDLSITEENQDRALAVTVAQHVPEKGLDIALEALVRSGRPWKWLVIGQETPWTKQLKEFIRQRSKEIEIELLGPLAHKDVLRVLRRCQVAVFTQRVAIFDLAILEAMALGKPIVATRVGGNIEALGDTNPLLGEDVDQLASALQRVYDDLTIAREVGQRNRERFLKNFTITAMIQVYNALYRHVAFR